ncbi:MAG: ABC transporter substrate-binding protein, partial [Janthinobacterium lividum]
MPERPSTWTLADDSAVETALRHGASRRDLLRILAAGGLSLSAAGAILGQTRPAMAAPSKGGHLKIAAVNSSNADTLDPARGSNSTDYTRCIALYNRLTNLDANSNIVMELAEAIDTTDAKVWTVKLRRGITFHDGKAFTADDVIYTLKRHLDPATGSKVGSIAKQMTGFKAVDDHTVEVTLASPNADLPTIFTPPHFLIVADGTTDFAKGNGTGPFILQSFQPGVRSLMRRNDSFWGTGGGPYVDSFEQFAIADDTARVNALLSGDIHIAAAINPRAMRPIDGKAGFTVLKSPSSNYNDLNFRLDMSPGDKADFVLGMKSLVNREAILRSALRGQGSLGNDQPVFPGNPLRNDDLKPRTFDPDKAKFYLNKAGMIGQTVSIITSDAVGSSVDIAMILQSDA